MADRNVEVLGHARSQIFEYRHRVPVLEAIVADDNVRGDDWQACGDRRGVKIVHAQDVVEAEHVPADLVQVQAARGGLHEDRPGFPDELDGTREDEGGDEQAGHGVGALPSCGRDDDRRDYDAQRAQRVVGHL